MSTKKKKLEILNDIDFKKLRVHKSFITIVLTILTLIVYYGFISLIAFNKPFLASKITQTITIGIPIGIGVIVLSWVFTGIYVWWANKKYDHMVNKVKEKIGE